MRKRIIATLILLAMVLSAAPMSAYAAGNALEDKYFPSGAISAPTEAPVLQYHEETEDYGEYLEMFYFYPDDLKALIQDYMVLSREEKEDLYSLLGVYGFDYCVETDIQIDGGSWHYSEKWDSPYWEGYDGLYAERIDDAFKFWSECHGPYRGYGHIFVFEPEQLYGEASAGYLSDLQTKKYDEYNYETYHFNFDNHYITLRYRLGVRYETSPGKKTNVIFSGWSPETVYGDTIDETDITVNLPDSISAPVLSDVSTVKTDTGVKVSFFCAIDDSLFDIEKYNEIVEKSKDGALFLETEVRVNGGEWEKTSPTKSGNVQTSYRTVKPATSKLTEASRVDIRSRITCDSLGITSEWSNIASTEDAPGRVIPERNTAEDKVPDKTPVEYTSSEWAKPELEKSEKLDLIPDSLKDADMTRPITRAEFAAVSVKAYEALSGNKAGPSAVNPFSDTNDPEVLKAFALVITTGTSDITFEPDSFLNREQAATMLTRVYKKVAINGWEIARDAEFNSSFGNMFTTPAPFADDAIISDWAKQSVYFMVSKNIINGIGNNLFAPRATSEAEQISGYAQATREQAIIIATRMVENLK